MPELILDLETTWSLKDRYTQKQWKKVSDKGSPFTQKNKVVCIGCYNGSEYKLFNLDVPENKSVLTSFLEYIKDYDTIIGHNIKFDAHWLEVLGVPITDYKLIDTLVTEYVLSRGEKVFGALALDKVAPEYGGTNKIDIIKKMWEGGMDTTEIPKSLLHRYLYLDVYNTYKVYKGQKKHKLYKELSGMIDFSNDLVHISRGMESEGISIDQEIGHIIVERFETEKKALERELMEFAQPYLPEGQVLELGSAHQMSQLLYGLKIPTMAQDPERRKGWNNFIKNFNIFDKEAEIQLQRAVSNYAIGTGFGFKVKPHKRHVGKTGFSTSNKAIEEMSATGHIKGEAKKFVKLLLEFTKRNTWVDSNYWGLAQAVRPDGRIHGNFNQVGTHTGRYSSNDPNLLNLPSKNKNEGKNDVKRMVVSRYGDEGVICCPDFSQIELRVLMEISGSETGITHYKEGVDLHTSKARWAINHYFGKNAWENGTDENRKAWRDGQKAVNFGLVYGLSPRDELQKAMYQAFYNDYPEVKIWQDKAKQQILSLGYYRSPITGMQYGFSKANSDNFYRGYTTDGRGWKNKALNFPIQGDAGRLAQMSMISLQLAIKEAGLEGVHIIGQVYDSIVIDCHKNTLDKLKGLCLTTMENINPLLVKYGGRPLSVPLAVDWSYGDNWFEQKEN
tara:strand:+ start:470 stop:2485 length:2016 start_codon:yes stop_codon:yes gene_type:complete